jgi:hypothetical protein
VHNEYVFLVHKNFAHHLKKFINTTSEKSQTKLIEQFCKCRTNPLAGKRLHLGKTELFGGFIYNLRIGGKKGYRFIYYANPKQHMVIGIYISTEVRRKFDYKKYDWNAIVDPILTDYVSQNYDAFQTLEDAFSDSK